MIRRALIIYCDNTSSGSLPGPVQDEKNYRNFLTSNLGGEWNDTEIKSLNNPTALLVEQMRQIFLNGADYTFIIFTGHGFINTVDNNFQYVELSDKHVSVRQLITDAKRQTIIFDACRGFESFNSTELIKAVNENIKMFSAGISTRFHFDKAILAAEEGLTILYAAGLNQSAKDSADGALYLLALLRESESWAKEENNLDVLTLKAAHNRAVSYIENSTTSLQNPTMEPEKRNRYFPFALKLKNQTIYG